MISASPPVCRQSRQDDVVRMNTRFTGRKLGALRRVLIGGQTMDGLKWGLAVSLCLLEVVPQFLAQVTERTWGAAQIPRPRFDSAVEVCFIEST